MKKKNIIKKLLSVALSAATVFSLLTLPAHAIVPGEDAYSESKTIARYDYDTQITEYYQVSTTEETFDFVESLLSADELARRNSDCDLQDIIGQDDRNMTVNLEPFDGVVLIVTKYDLNGDREADTCITGTGFMVSKKVMVTAMHNIYRPDKCKCTGLCVNCWYTCSNCPELCENCEGPSEEVASLETIIYQGANVFLDPEDYENEIDYLTILDQDTTIQKDTAKAIDYDPYYFTAYAQDPDYSTEWDWCVVTLRDGFETFHFPYSTPNSADIVSANSNITLNTQISNIGYPVEHSFTRWGCDGYVVSISGGILEHSADTSPGQSGGPIATLVAEGEVICFAIHTGGSPVTNYNRACIITTAISNSIAYAIRQTIISGAT